MELPGKRDKWGLPSERDWNNSLRLGRWETNGHKWLTETDIAELEEAAGRDGRPLGVYADWREMRHLGRAFLDGVSLDRLQDHDGHSFRMGAEYYCPFCGGRGYYPDAAQHLKSCAYTQWKTAIKAMDGSSSG